MSENGRYRQLVLAGGGTRCFWHGGFLAAVREPLALRPERVSGVSGGALSAAAFLSERGDELLEFMCEAFEDVDENVAMDPGDTAGEGLTPHQRVYQAVVARTLPDDAVQRVADGPAFQVLVAHPPGDSRAKTATVPALLAYELDKKLRSTPEFRLPAASGVEHELVDARQAARDGKLVELICNAAVIPPVFRLQGWNGRPVIDGGMVHAAPMPDPDEGETLVLLTRHYRNLPRHPAKTWVEPSDETPADKLDFTDPTGLRRTWALGREDGERFLEQLAIDPG